jgi:hypothetical protein
MQILLSKLNSIIECMKQMDWCQYNMRRSVKVDASRALSAPLLRTLCGQFKIMSLPLGGHAHAQIQVVDDVAEDSLRKRNGLHSMRLRTMPLRKVPICKM